MQRPINLLPASYWRQQRRRHRTIRQSALLIVLTGSLVAWWLVQGEQTAPLRAQANELERQVRWTQDYKQEIVTLRQRAASLHQRVRVRDLLAAPVAHTQILATLAQRMPESVTLMRMSATTERPAARRPGQSRDESASTAEANAPHEVRIKLTALAPDDMTIASLLSALKGHALFSEAKMRYTRTVEHDEVIARQFQLAIRVDLDRTFEPIADAGGDAGGEGVAHAD